MSINRYRITTPGCKDVISRGETAEEALLKVLNRRRYADWSRQMISDDGGIECAETHASKEWHGSTVRVLAKLIVEDHVQ